jgi:hypothetical protein
VVIFSFEHASWSIAAILGSLFFFMVTCALLKWASTLVENRIPSAEMVQQLYSFVTTSIRSHSLPGGMSNNAFLPKYNSDERGVTPENQFGFVNTAPSSKNVNKSIKQQAAAINDNTDQEANGEVEVELATQTTTDKEKDSTPGSEFDHEQEDTVDRIISLQNEH